MSPTPFSNHSPLILVGVLTFLGILAYGLFVATPYLRGPKLTVESPKPGSSIPTPTVIVRGTTERVSYLSIDDLAVPLLEDGSFQVERAYPAGYTVVVVRVRDRFGRELTDTVEFLHTTNLPTHGIQKESGSEAESEGN
jgi:hypothetical protein